MTNEILISPVTRIEGHAKISIHLDANGKVSNAVFHVTQFRGFEKFCEGRPLFEMPGITTRVCGICPISHSLTSAKACEMIMRVSIPPAADKLRRLINLAQILQSHAVSFFHLSSPDLLLGWDTPPEKRNIFGLIAENPDLARAGIRLRQFGQEMIEGVAGKRIHPDWIVPGGVRNPLTENGRAQIQDKLPETYATVIRVLNQFKNLLRTHQEEADTFGNFPSLFMGLVASDGAWEHYTGKLRIVDDNGNIVADQLDGQSYQSFIGESVQDSSYLKSPYFKDWGFPNGMYRVGPLARLNLCERMGTPLADQEWRSFRDLRTGAITSSFMYHYARLIEILACLERIEQALEDPDLLGRDIRAEAGINRTEGVGVSEAPRGTLFHHYAVDSHGLVNKVNLIIATNHNNLAMNRTITQIAQHYVHGDDVPESMLNRVEAGIRCYDPCLSCSTHAFGQMPQHIQLIKADGTVLKVLRKS
jgi:NAD-reducing hydrogenase large subunit